MEHKYNELRKQIRDAFVDDEKSGMFPTVDWVMNYLIAQGRVVPDGYVLVPLEPTKEMVMEMSICCGGSYDQIKDNWSRMIATAPKGETK